MPTPIKSDRDPNTISTSLLTEENLDKGVGRCCIFCGWDNPFDYTNIYKWIPIIIIKAPWIGGFDGDRPYAIVRECPKCYKLSWCHVSEWSLTIIKKFESCADVKIDIS